MKRRLGKCVLSANGLAKRVQRRFLSRSVTLEVFQSEILAIVGENGAGKSTLLSILAKVEKPNEGTVKYHVRQPRGRGVLAGLRALYLGRRTVALCPQQPMEFSRLTLEEHIRLICTVGGHGNVRSAEYARMYFPQIPLDCPYNALSYANRKLLEALRFLALARPIVFLDEPFAGADASKVALISEAIKAAGRTGAVVFVDHRIQIALRIADRVLRLSAAGLVEVAE